MTLDRAIGDAPRWMFLGILVFAPWAYGCTRVLTGSILNQFSAVLMVFWLVGCLWRGRSPRVAWLPAALLTLLLLQGWWMAYNAHSFHVYRTWTTVTRIWDNPPLPGWPGAIDRFFAQRAMLNFTAMSAFFLFACDLMSRPVWRKRVWLTLAFTAVSVAIGGTVLHLGGPAWREWVWDSTVAQSRTTFATYRYHGNAASLMSIGWALMLGWTLAAASQRGRPLRFAGWVLASLCLLFGLFMNTSRAGWGLAVFIASLIGTRFLWAWWGTAREHFSWKAGLVQVAFMLAVAGTLTAVALSDDWKLKLARLNTAVEMSQKRYPTEVYHELVSETGVLGHGADCFQMALPPYMEAFGLVGEGEGFWQHAHNDYYEYLVNWGWWGLALWIWLIGGGLWLGLRDHFRMPVLWGSAQWVLSYCGCAAMVGILLHARWDFPLEKASILLYFLTLVADGWGRALQNKATSDANAPAAV